MSRGRGAGGRGRGGGGIGRGGMASLPAGMTFEDVISASKMRDPTPLYPAFRDLPVVTHITDQEREICKYQMGFADRFKKSVYYLVDTAKDNKINTVPRYSDKYNVVAKKRPKLDPSVLEPSLFPKNVWDEYFNAEARSAKRAKATDKKPKINLDALLDTEEKEEGEEDEERKRESEGEEGPIGDYDEDEEEFGDDDYVNNYFDNGEGDGDDAFDVGGDDEGGVD